MEKVNPHKILILGSAGMLGHMVYRTFSEIEGYELFDLSLSMPLNSNTIIFDVQDTVGLEKIIYKIKPNYIINCIGMLIRKSNKDKEKAIFINAYFPHYLQRLSEQIDFKLIHISTDCVFDGKKGVYSENSLTDAQDLYGKTKALGEFNNQKHLCIRTSIIGPELKENGEGLLHWLFNQKGKIFGYKGVFWGGVTTLELSRAIHFSIENKITGLWNLTNGKPISKFSLLDKIINTFSIRQISLVTNSKKVSDKSLTSNRGINYKVPSYDQMLIELKVNFEQNKSIYNYQI